MIAEDLDDAALGDLATAALSDHAFEFILERLQARDTAIDLLKLIPRDFVHLPAGLIGVVAKVQQLADRV